jgi:hypothetical protein
VELVKSELSDRGTVSNHADDSANAISNGNREEVMEDNEQDVDRMEVDESSDGLHL